MKLVLILAIITLSTVAQAKDAPPAPPRIGWVDWNKLQASATEVARVKAHALVARTQEQANQILNQGSQDGLSHLKDACAKVKADKHLSMVVENPLAADPADEVTAEVLKLWNAADEASVAAENTRLTARVAQLEAAALTKPAPPAVAPAPPIQPAHVAKK